MDWINKLKQIMTDKGVNIEQLKTKIEKKGHSLSRNSIGNILNGRNSPKIETIQLITNALEVEVWELFSDSITNNTEKTINGFVEFENKIHKLKTKNDLKQLLELIEKDTNDASSTNKPESIIQKTHFYGVQSHIRRGGGHKKTTKLTRHIFKKYNITVCDKKEFVDTPNDLKRDTKIWAFRSKEDALAAQNILRRQLDFKFNQ